MACPVIGVANYPRGNSLTETVLNDARDVRAPLTDLDTCGCPPANVTQLLDGEAIGSGSQGYQELQPKFLRALH